MPTKSLPARGKQDEIVETPEFDQKPLEVTPAWAEVARSDLFTRVVEAGGQSEEVTLLELEQKKVELKGLVEEPAIMVIIAREHDIEPNDYELIELGLFVDIEPEEVEVPPKKVTKPTKPLKPPKTAKKVKRPPTRDAAADLLEATGMKDVADYIRKGPRKTVKRPAKPSKPAKMVIVNKPPVIVAEIVKTVEVREPEVTSLATLPVMGIVRPCVGIREAKQAWLDFQEIKRELLTENDVIKIGKNTHIKKSGWRKVSTVFNLSDEVISAERERFQHTRTVKKKILVPAKLVKPTKPAKPTKPKPVRMIKKTIEETVVTSEFLWRIHVRVTAPNGRVVTGVGSCSTTEAYDNPPRHFGHPDHEVYATAHTRAKSRAISDIVGGGEVSAEELE